MSVYTAQNESKYFENLSSIGIDKINIGVNFKYLQSFVLDLHQKPKSILSKTNFCVYLCMIVPCVVYFYYVDHKINKMLSFLYSLL